MAVVLSDKVYDDLLVCAKALEAFVSQIDPSKVHKRFEDAGLTPPVNLFPSENGVIQRLRNAVAAAEADVTDANDYEFEERERDPPAYYDMD